jgi:hypothetical protein
MIYNFKTSINCQSFKYPDKCLHQAAPRFIFGCADCVLTRSNFDPRVNVKCNLQTPTPKPKAPPKAP